MTTFALRIDAGHPSLPGHFPSRPVVPGVLLLDAVAARLPGPIARIAQVKFLAPLLPEQDACIELDIDSAARRARFRVLRGDLLLASGDLLYAAP